MSHRRAYADGGVLSPTVTAAWEPDQDRRGAGQLDLLVGDVARVLDCPVAFVGELDDDGRSRIVASSGVDGDLSAGPGCWGGRQPWHGSTPVLEALDPDLDAGLIEAAGGELTHVLTTPVPVFGADDARVLVAGFSTPPYELERTFWIADCFARLFGLLLHDGDALEGVLQPARHDGLTGCLTYESVRAELVREINRSARAALPLTCCFIDLDGFKRVNDGHGHLRGNAVLAEVGRVLREGVRSCDTVGRYGGDEFIAILPQTREPEAARLAARLRSQIARQAEGSDEPLTASIGVAAWAIGMTAEQLLARADQALFAAKGRPGGVVTIRPASG